MLLKSPLRGNACAGGAPGGVSARSGAVTDPGFRGPK